MSLLEHKSISNGAKNKLISAIDFKIEEINLRLLDTDFIFELLPKLSCTSLICAQLSEISPSLFVRFVLNDWGRFTEIFDEVKLTVSGFVTLLSENLPEEKLNFLYSKMDGSRLCNVLLAGISVPKRVWSAPEASLTAEQLSQLAGRLNAEETITLIIINKERLTEQVALILLIPLGGIYLQIAQKEIKKIEIDARIVSLIEVLESHGVLIESFEKKSKNIYLTYIE